MNIEKFHFVLMEFDFLLPQLSISYATPGHSFCRGIVSGISVGVIAFTFIEQNLIDAFANNEVIPSYQDEKMFGKFDISLCNILNLSLVISLTKCYYKCQY